MHCAVECNVNFNATQCTNNRFTNLYLCNVFIITFDSVQLLPGVAYDI